MAEGKPPEKKLAIASELRSHSLVMLSTIDPSKRDSAFISVARRSFRWAVDAFELFSAKTEAATEGPSKMAGLQGTSLLVRTRRVTSPEDVASDPVSFNPQASANPLSRNSKTTVLPASRLLDLAGLLDAVSLTIRPTAPRLEFLLPPLGMTQSPITAVALLTWSNGVNVK